MKIVFTSSVCALFHLLWNEDSREDLFVKGEDSSHLCHNFILGSLKYAIKHKYINTSHWKVTWLVFQPIDFENNKGGKNTKAIAWWYIACFYSSIYSSMFSIFNSSWCHPDTKNRFYIDVFNTGFIFVFYRKQ